MNTMRSEFAANQALAQQPGRRETVSKAHSPETLTAFNLVSDNPIVNSVAIGFAVVAALASIGATVANFFA